MNTSVGFFLMFMCLGAFYPRKFKDFFTLLTLSAEVGFCEALGANHSLLELLIQNTANTKILILFFSNLVPVLLWCEAIDVGRVTRGHSAKQGTAKT